MAYYLTTKNKNSFDIVDITKSKKFKKLSTYTKEGACSLKEIDNFTIQFNNEADMKKQLFLEEIIDSEQGFKTLSVRIKNKDNYKKVMYEALYKDNAGHFVAKTEREYRSLLKDEIGELSVGRIIFEYLQKINDVDFLDKFVRTFYNYYECRLSINDLGCYVSDSKRTGIFSRYLESTFMETLYSLCYGYDKINETKVKNYKNIHTLAAFIAHQDKKKNNIENDFVPKKRIKMKEVPNQTSLFD